jgi:hypothetical protein
MSKDFREPERLADFPPNEQGIILVPGGAALAFSGLWANTRVQRPSLSNLNERVDGLVTTLNDVKQTGTLVSDKLREDFISFTKTLHEEQKGKSLPNDLNKWSQPEVAANLTPGQSAMHKTWTGLRDELQILDHNNAIRLGDAASIQTIVRDTHYSNAARLPQLRELNLKNGEPEFGKYNALVENYNSRITGMLDEQKGYTKLEGRTSAKIGAGVIAAFGTNTALDYTVFKDRSVSLVTSLTDMASPAVGALLTRKFGPAAMYVAPVVAHIGEKLLYEHTVPQSG